MDGAWWDGRCVQNVGWKFKRPPGRIRLRGKNDIKMFIVMLL
jgi:hypothetical protein